MKKKLLIILCCMTAMGLLVFSYVNEDEAYVNKNWELTSDQMKNITIKGISQDVDIYLQKGETNQLLLEGLMPVSFAEKLADFHPGNEEMVLDFATSMGISVAKISGDKLKMIVRTTDETNVEKLLVQINKGNVYIEQDKVFANSYELKTNQGVVSQPDQKSVTQGSIKVELGFGDITVNVFEEE
ncbi:hypothetical protein [Enterococcus sp. RIT-PI-f]|uniref:hypothetical protein n=1 Tax=Enterococcus sp. RIT-PI-f TaxID=1690244 RepID=UPI0006B92E02|nr:hypothetical protein [Enterococcus sp. RIT-PI-f]KPG72019.1 hypothetical protein AEQ18_02945 [Enterococcus sp. RIT-PI-f]